MNKVLIKTIIIKSIPRKVIKINGVWVYKHHRCVCGCNERIPFNHSHIKTGIPIFINGHQNRGENNSFFGKHHSSDTKEEQSKARKKYYQENPGATSGENNGMYGKHHSIKTKKELSKSSSGKNNGMYDIHLCGEDNGMYGKTHSSITIEKMRKARKKFFKEHPEMLENLSKARKKYWQDLDLYSKAKIMKRVRKFQKYVSNSELIVRTELDNLKIKYIPNVHEIEGTPDDVIPTKDGHPIALFVDGCYWHGCKCKDWNKVEYYLFERMIEQKIYDRMINKKLTKQGYKVIRIWEHDVKNEKYKKILNKVIYNGTR